MSKTLKVNFGYTALPISTPRLRRGQDGVDIIEMVELVPGFAVNDWRDVVVPDNWNAE